jgi:hypothetical protein
MLKKQIHTVKPLSGRAILKALGISKEIKKKAGELIKEVYKK